ncbi:uncharacterized protein LOC128557388 [Mercenaria mercenaria]|uniref:uncharacterized protein LOC128557388 n=1 Tax=Mercenaria mercenaria TaxID=6596 RepID=UPI00234E824B|nr:uncharacterized protein LOC128557388 [Mercenaria mercenaria]
MQPYLSSLEKISFPLHYKFERNQDKVNLFYKGPHYNDWIQMEDSILPRKPPGKPMNLTPDYTRINVDRNIKQVEQLKQLFKNENSFDFWNQFYKAIKDNTRQIPESSWILDELPRQGNIPTIEETNIPSHLKDIISKETTVPQVVVRRKITSQSKQQTAKGKQTVNRKKQTSVNRSKQGKPNGK